jgi:hypothetical protein
MFDQIFGRSDALRRQLAGPLREARLAYLHYRAEQGAPRGTLRKLAQYLLVVTERLNLQPQGRVTTTQIERAADRWASLRPAPQDQRWFLTQKQIVLRLRRY